MSLEARLQATTSDYQKIQSDLTTAVDARQRLGAQLTESEMVKKEFSTLKPSNTVYKLMGPVLVKQEQVQAKADVDRRLEFIRGEIKRVEAQLKDLEERSEKRKTEIVEIQTAHQQTLQQKQTGTLGEGVLAQ